MNTEIKNKYKYKRLGGWLGVLQVALLVNAFSWLRNVQLFLGLKEEFGNKISTEVIRMNFIWFELISSFVMLGFSAIVIYYFMKRKIVFKILILVYLAFEVIVELLVFFLFAGLTTNQEFGLYTLLFKVVIAGLIAGYILKSERVQKTFVEA